MSSDATDNTMRAELLPCPFCGGDPYPCAHKTYQHYGVNCVCGASGPAGWAGPNPTPERIFQAMGEGLAGWNRRAAARQVAGWQPIATAPKNGTNVLLVNRRGNMATGLWMESLSGTGWYLRGSSRGPDAFFNDHHGPTHWMPLPAPPTDASQHSKPDREPSEG